MTRLIHAPLLALAFLAGCAPAPAVPVPAGVRFVSRAEWGALAPSSEMKTHALRRLTIHHTAERQAPTRSTADKLGALQRFSQSSGTLGNGRPKRAWPDVPYHLYVAADGSVGEGREIRFVGDTNTPYDPTGHLLVVVEGNFENETLTGPQRRTLEILLLVLTRRYRIPADSIAAHRDFAETLCPGRSLYAEIPALRALVAATQR
ncbi:MAG TPA: peptidoglycan recognition family protein [Longimicrobium sp.]|nr:peptidoglycan recognition family protein [Longimicrobium sp.]